jgi:hypothetical protein
MSVTATNNARETRRARPARHAQHATPFVPIRLFSPPSPPWARYREEVFELRHKLDLVDASQWATTKAAFEAHLISDLVFSDVLTAAAHASFSQTRGT